MLKKATLKEAELLCNSDKRYFEAELLCNEDPVRPNIPFHWRVAGPCREVYYLKLPDWIFKNQKDQHSSTIERELKQVGSVICVAYLQYIPINEDELMTMNYGQNYAIFYSLWSNKKGQGKLIVHETLKHLQNKHTDMRYITMSPKTKMAMDFHIKNGAKLLRENPLTYNFEYLKTK